MPYTALPTDEALPLTALRCAHVLVDAPYPILMNLSAGTVLISMLFLAPLCLFVRLAGYGCCTICSFVTSSAPMTLCMCSSPNGPLC